jgi:hypothetical protein
LRIRHLTGKFIPTKKGRPPTFDDNLSYIVAIDSAEISVSMASMTHVRFAPFRDADSRPFSDRAGFRS